MKAFKYILLTSAFVFLPFIAAISLFAGVDEHNPSDHWDYEGELGPDHWDKLKRENWQVQNWGYAITYRHFCD